MKSKRIPAVVTMAVVLAVLGGSAVTVQDKYAVQVPDGLAFSEFRGYETWQVVSVSKTDDRNDLAQVTGDTRDADFESPL
jgi:hypothetical protein